MDTQAQDTGSRDVGAARHFQHYEIDVQADGTTLVELGRGAMGVTYKARDVNLDVPVALKVVNALYSTSYSVLERFRREARAAAQLRHPNVASVFHFSQTESGQRFYAMEFIDGETLAQKVQRDGPLPAAVVVEMASQVTSALIAADQHGLVHRDLKPGNLMLVKVDERPRRSSTSPPLLVKVIDFGLAKAVADAAEAEAPLTQGGFLGTPAYASPEQAQGGTVDSRSDIYALGATLWFALTGRAPFAGTTMEEVQDRQRHRPLPTAQLDEANVPAPLAELVKSMLDPKPSNRPESPVALQEALEQCRIDIGGAPSATVIGSRPPMAQRRRFAGWGIAAAAAFLAAVATSALVLSRRPSIPAASPMATAATPIPEKSIAVLPFANMTANAENGFFADGVQDEILSNLSKIADLKVISRTSVMQYRGAKHDVKEIGRQLGVAHLLEGSVQRANNRVRVTAQLVDARTDTTQWSEHYDRDLADVFAIQTEIASTIAAQLQAKLSPAEKAAIEKPPTTNLAAYDLYSRAKSLIDTITFNTRAKGDLVEAVQLLDEAVALDPKFLRAYCQTANAHGILYLLGYDHTPERLALADAAVQNALRIAPDSGDAHYARADNLYRCHLDYAGALAELAIVQKSLPNDPRVYLLRGFIDRRQGRDEEGLQNMARALKFDPRNLYTLHQIALSYEMMHKYADYAETLERALAVAPDDLDTKAERASVDLKWRANPVPLHAVIDSILPHNPAEASTVADKWIDLALSERSAEAARAAVRALGDNTFGQDAIRLNYHVANGLIARMEGNEAAATAAFTAARERQLKLQELQPGYAPGLVVMSLIDAGLGRKDDALRESQRAIDLLPRKSDSINAPLVQAYAAIVAAWCGEKDLAIERLTQSLKLPSKVNYGQLKLHPFWDPLRGDPRFERIVASLAPNGKS